MQKVFWGELEKIFRSEEKRRLKEAPNRVLKIKGKDSKKSPKTFSEVKKEFSFPCDICPIKGKVVPPEGSKNGVMLVGMLPGVEEESSGRPFVGRSGQLLRKTCVEVGFNEEELYFTNVVKCRLTNDRGDNRDPTSQEMKLCGRFLLQEIKEVNPKLVVLLGDVPLKFIFNKSSISKYRGMVLQKGDYQFFLTYHPAYILRNKNSDEEKLWKKDFESIYRLANGVKQSEDDVLKVVCRSYEDMDLWLDKLLNEADRYVLDIESWAPGKSKEKKALDPWASGFRVDMVSFSWFSDGKWMAVCIPLEHPESTFDLNVTLDKLCEFFSKCEKKGIKLIGQNIKWDLKVLEKRFGFKIKSLHLDTMVVHTLVVGKKSGHSLERMSIDYLGVDPYKQALRQELAGETVAIDKLADMNMDDCVNTLKLSALFEDQLNDIVDDQKKSKKSSWNILRCHNEIIVPGMQVLKKMELRGMPVNLDYLHGLKKDLEDNVESIKKRIYSYPELGNHQELSLTSTLDLNEILYGIFGFEPPGRRTNLGFSVDKEDLDRLAGRYEHPIILDLQEFKLLKKLQSTYVLPYISKHVKEDGRVHGTFNLHVALSGRLSSENPNLQNIPVRIGGLILKMFEAPEGWQIIAADYSQIELRVVCSASRDPRMTEAFMSGEDIHKKTYSEMFDIPLDEVTPEQRYEAKGLNFGIIYGMQDEGLAEALGISVGEAHVKREKYLDTYSGIRGYVEEMKKQYHRKGFVETLFGRRIYIYGPDEGYNERRAVNGPIQGTATDINQLSLIDIDGIEESKGMRMGGINVIHDSQIYLTPEDELEEGKKLIKDTMENLDLDFMNGIPLKADIGIGKNLGEAMGKE